MSTQVSRKETRHPERWTSAVRSEQESGLSVGGGESCACEACYVSL